MRRIAIAITLSAGCFGEPEPDDHIIGTTVPMTTSAEESSSSSDGESSSGEESSTSETVDPGDCPEWCIQGCDKPLDIAYCRCTQDEYCQDGLSCDRPNPDILGHCR